MLKMKNYIKQNRLVEMCWRIKGYRYVGYRGANKDRYTYCAIFQKKKTTHISLLNKLKNYSI
jgi:hypothetical protein